MQITTNDGKVINLNEEQEKAIVDFRQFMDSKDLFICLSGSAGTGKTTIAIEALRDYSGIIVTAPTHKAKKEISIKTGYKAKTIHSLCGLRPDMNLEEFSQKNMQFSQSYQDTIAEYNIVCIDESSMLNKELVCLIKEKASQYKIKILFMGDIMQLPPVKEQIGLVFTDDEIKQIKLTKVERQAEGNPLFEIYDSILKDINSSSNNYEKITKINDKKEGYDFIFNIKDFGEKALDYFALGQTENKIICWTNNKVRQWNNYIRKQLFGNTHDLQIGEILMSYRSVWDDNEQEYITFNSCEYKVIKSYQSEKNEYIGYYTTIQDLDIGVSNTIFIIKNDENNISKFIKEENRLATIAKTAKKEDRGYRWKQYYNFRNSYFIVRDIISVDGRLLVAKDFDYAYAITVHKSQGSTFDNVLIDEVDINMNNNYSERNRLKYVAFSRPRFMAIVNSEPCKQ